MLGDSRILRCLFWHSLLFQGQTQPSRGLPHPQMLSLGCTSWLGCAALVLRVSTHKSMEMLRLWARPPDPQGMSKKLPSVCSYTARPRQLISEESLHDLRPAGKAVIPPVLSYRLLREACCDALHPKEQPSVTLCPPSWPQCAQHYHHLALSVCNPH